MKSVRANYEANGTMYEWNSQYQGRPQLVGGGVVDTSFLQYIDREEVPEDMELIRGYDLAVSEKDFADYTAGALIRTITSILWI